MLKIGMLAIASLVGQTVMAPAAGDYTEAHEVQYRSPEDAIARIAELSADASAALEERIGRLEDTMGRFTTALGWSEEERRAINSTGHSTQTHYGAHEIPTATLHTTITTYELVKEGDEVWTDADIQSVIDFAEAKRNELNQALNG